MGHVLVMGEDHPMDDGRLARVQPGAGRDHEMDRVPKRGRVFDSMEKSGGRAGEVCVFGDDLSIAWQRSS
ncbi:MAG TPA: hypothetical protein VFC19_12100 [Candidatus Limnocylindrales bacterium]|nr:hypothetical protein [Candidatus Limnocylindrales bacterium]